jgi:hypothetical protein
MKKPVLIIKLTAILVILFFADYVEIGDSSTLLLPINDD